VQNPAFIENLPVSSRNHLNYTMHFSSLDYRQKSLIAEIAYLVFMCIISPLAVGLQVFTTSKLSFSLSLVLINVLSVPSIMLFYRLYLPYTVGRKKYFLAVLFFPVYLILYEINIRLSSLAVIALPFIPEGYRNNLLSANPGDFSHGYFRQTIGYTSLVLLGATSLYVVKLLFKNQHNLYRLETEKLKLELNHLKSQIQPHFFFNTLNNMYSLSVQNSPKTPRMITDLSAIMRYVLYETRNEKVSLEQEVNFIKSYINLENLRHDQPGIIDFSVQGNTGNIEIEPLLFLPLIENTFKHALHENIPDKWVKLVLAVDNDELIFQTSNPRPETSLRDKTKSGIGLANVKKRLELLYPGKHELIIHDEAGHFTVTLIIHL
jgi:two-component system, LytTR family, sensor kinase